MRNEMFQNIFDLLSEVLPNQWNKIILFVGYTEGSYSMKFYIQNVHEEYIDCFELEHIDNMILVRLFMAIDKIVSKERNLLSESERWNVMSMSVDSSSNMKAEFDYNDIGENMIKYEEQWRSRYLV